MCFSSSIFKITAEEGADGTIPIYNPHIITGPSSPKSPTDHFKVAALVVNAATKASRRASVAVSELKTLRKKKRRHEGFNMELFRTQVQKSLDAAVLANTLEAISPPKAMQKRPDANPTPISPTAAPQEMSSTDLGCVVSGSVLKYMYCI
jgi:hypothetical protein